MGKLSFLKEFKFFPTFSAKKAENFQKASQDLFHQPPKRPKKVDDVARKVERSMKKWPRFVKSKTRWQKNGSKVSPRSELLVGKMSRETPSLHSLSMVMVSCSQCYKRFTGPNLQVCKTGLFLKSFQFSFMARTHPQSLRQETSGRLWGP